MILFFFPFRFSILFPSLSTFISIVYCSYSHSGSWTLLEKPPIVQPLKNFPAFYGTRKFITVFTGPYPEPDQSNPYHPILSL
jgi:hypothetical protein